MRTHSTSQKGFTLIELLVVIAIIGILAGIVLVSLGSARNKGKDSAVQEQLSGLRSQMEIFYTTGSTYASGCAATQPLAILNGAKIGGATSVDTTLVTPETATSVECHDSASAWAAQAPLTSTTGGYWCVDSTGASKAEAAVLAASAVVCA